MAAALPLMIWFVFDTPCSLSHMKYCVLCLYFWGSKKIEGEGRGDM